MIMHPSRHYAWSPGDTGEPAPCLVTAGSTGTNPFDNQSVATGACSTISNDALTPWRIAPNAVALAARQHSLPLHPAQLYSALTAFLIAGITMSYYTLPHAAGRAFALMMILEGVTRFVLEMLRTEPPVWGTPLSLSMWLGLGLVLGGVILWVGFGRLASGASLRPAPAPAHA